MRLQDALRDTTISDVIDNWKITPIKDSKMMNDGRLKAGQVIRTEGGLYRVAHSNECRARIVPLTKKALETGREGTSGGDNIASTSYVEIIEDIERAKLEMELEATEKELAAAKREVQTRDRTEAHDTAAAKLAALEAEIASAEQTLGTAPKAPKTTAPRVGTGAGWRLAPGEVPSYKEGSLAARVYAYIKEHPGQTTAEIVVGVGGPGALAACVSRFNQAGIIERAS